MLLFLFVQVLLSFVRIWMTAPIKMGVGEVVFVIGSAVESCWFKDSWQRCRLFQTFPSEKIFSIIIRGFVVFELQLKAEIRTYLRPFGPQKFNRLRETHPFIFNKISYNNRSRLDIEGITRETPAPQCTKTPVVLRSAFDNSYIARFACCIHRSIS